MSFYCTRYGNPISTSRAFSYCMKRLPNGGKCNNLEKKKGQKNHANATIHRNGNGNRLLHRQVGLMVLDYETLSDF